MFLPDNRLFTTSVATTFLLLVALVLGCITPYQPETMRIPQAIVVDGTLTDQPGPHLVTLTYTSDFTQSALNLRVSGATVAIEDDRGQRQPLREVSTNPGVYQTPADYRGQVGRSYRLAFSVGGKTYRSEPERIRAVPKIDSIYAEYTEVPIAGTLNFDKGFNIYVDTRDPATLGDYYRWRWTHYKPISICEVRAERNTNPVIEYSYPCCSECWDIIRCYGNTCINVASDARINGRAISRQFVLRAPFTSTERYYVEIEQQALSAGAFRFWDGVDKLTNQNGGIFDAAPASIRGNIVCETDPNEVVYGYFSAAGSATVPYFLDRSRVRATPNTEPPFPPFPPGPPPPCTVCADNAFRTPNRPRWWVY